ncbi:enoyl-CoA hydratase/isomerase family protein [Rhodococcus sp. ARC_M8]|uniref:enoyl-CoA hydratase/isomerase family protein n=1 Tax=Rhodococcus sp. ARC_M8 TaxID=2928853 RepID=UPI001FB30DCA|nr:enoyl-CoA hydratase/isomerase family protein [Rhodococcus sp. ARC_M8]MCJ0949986.1 enoyl-CoA hydratase/isomerase family protein [Rhodococcus sp. ARC_M8]
MSNLVIERHGPIAELWINRAEVLNALSGAVQEEIISTLADFEDDPRVEVLIVAGRGRAFTAGSDRTEIAAFSESTQQRLASFARGERLVRSFLDSRLTVVLAAHGYCVGGGVSMALASDICVAADDTQFFIPELALGMPYLWQSTPLLLASIGASRAKALIATGDRFDAAQAQMMGIVHRTFAASTLHDEARRLAARLVETPRHAREAQKQLSTRALDRLLAQDESLFVRTAVGEPLAR